MSREIPSLSVRDQVANRYLWRRNPMMEKNTPGIRPVPCLEEVSTYIGRRRWTEGNNHKTLALLPHTRLSSTIPVTHGRISDPNPSGGLPPSHSLSFFVAKSGRN